MNLLRIFCLALFAATMFFTACGGDSGSGASDEISVNSSDDEGLDAASSSGKTSKKSSSSKGNSAKSSESATSSSSVIPGTDRRSSSSVAASSGAVSDVGISSSSFVLVDSLCDSEYEGGSKFISKYNLRYRCINGHWILQSSSSVARSSSSSKYYDMSELFVNDQGYSYGEFTDPRDGQVYKTIRYEVLISGLDSITFFAQNLNYGKMIDAGIQMTDSTKFCYDDDPWYCDNGFGGLYTWASAMNFPAACDSFGLGTSKCPVEYDLMKNPIPEAKGALTAVLHQGICPEGWHVMNQEEWGLIMKGSISRNGANYLGAVLWGSNQRGFSLLPAGDLKLQSRYSNEKQATYQNIEKYACHWMPGEYDSEEHEVLGRIAFVADNYVNRPAGLKKVNGASVRCAKDY
ncbi:FISUMP domain-containing protein [Fibrobacter sp. UWH6]|uniref:FISUMP domain-containing protein n=1 Tax=Fibrobacter sp. (strain UWH6) TaxID=1896212 RepID=UPI00092340F4|nr:FISUMP domain-containing protein [Fibrobacter sp. UWH6]SHL50754.1 major paralogous domain-containing protein [Fibrobacter sp. UWH6]